MSINTVNTAIIWGTKRLSKIAPQDAHLESELLLSHILKKTRLSLLLNPHKPLSATQVKKYSELVKKRSQGHPVAYLVGHKGFYDLDFIVTPDTLIPRPETELLVELVLQASSLLPPTSCRILDIGTGPGTIALTLGKHLPQAKVVAVDISDKALAVARKNKKALKVPNVRFTHSDLIEEVTQKPDILTANLPYLTKSELAEPSITKEPRLALYGGTKGTELYEKLFEQIREKDWHDLTLYLEIGATQAKPIKELAKKHLKVKKVTVHKDYAKKDRVVAIEL